MPAHKKPDKNFKWTPELAYAIGLLVTDGCLSKDGRHIIMRSKEPEQLENFKKCLGLQNNIKPTKTKELTHYRLQFGNVQLYRWLIKIGLTPNKTYTIGKIKIPNKYFRDFLRGHLDGDGNIMLYVDKYNFYKGRNYVNNRLYTRFVSASQKHAEWLQTEINRNLKLKGALICEKPKDKKKSPDVDNKIF